jgi:hypothetical protein
MAGGFLEEYGVGDVRREKTIRWIVIAAALLVIGSIVGYFVFRTWPAKRRVEAFLDKLREGDYQTAYRMWGCEQPCRDYSFERFLEDWGVKGGFGDPKGAEVKETSFCNTGVIVTVAPAKGPDVALWYERSNSTLSFSPWPVCVERIPAPDAPSQTPPQ